jgi:hypothetical protein
VISFWGPTVIKFLNLSCLYGLIAYGGAVPLTIVSLCIALLADRWDNGDENARVLTHYACILHSKNNDSSNMMMLILTKKKYILVQLPESELCLQYLKVCNCVARDNCLGDTVLVIGLVLKHLLWSLWMLSFFEKNTSTLLWIQVERSWGLQRKRRSQ